MNESRNGHTRPKDGEGGFSIVELLIAMLILSAIVVGVLPLFQRSVVANLSSSGTTELVNVGQTAVEDIARQNFDSALLTLGAGTESVVEAYFDQDTHTWVPGPPPPNTSAMTRTMRIRQFGISAIDDGIVENDEALNWDADPKAVHLKQVVVELEGRKKHLKLPHQTIDLTLIKSN